MTIWKQEILRKKHYDSSMIVWPEHQPGQKNTRLRGTVTSGKNLGSGGMMRVRPLLSKKAVAAWTLSNFIVGIIGGIMLRFYGK